MQPYCDGTYEGDFGDANDLAPELGVAPLVAAGALALAKKIPVLGGLLGKGYDKKKWRDRSRAVQQAAAAGDLAALDRMANVHSAWGSVYNPIRTAARQAAAAIRAAQATVKPGAAPVPLPPVAPIPEPPSGGGTTLPSPIQQAIDQAGEAAGAGFRRGATAEPILPAWVLPVGIAAGAGLLLVLLNRPAPRQ